MIQHASTDRRLNAAIAAIDDRVVAVAGPPGVGKTAVLLSLIARGARPVAFERADVTPAGLVVSVDNVRIRARHVRLVGDAIRLRPWQRTWLRIGAIGSRIPIIGARIGRRCFVDVPPGAVRARASVNHLDLVVVLDPDAVDGPRPARAGDLGSYLGPDVDAPSAVVVGVRGRSSEEVAAAVGDLARQC